MEDVKKWVCAECGHEQHSDNGGCGACRSPRVILVTMAEDLMGPDWRRTFAPPVGAEQAMSRVYIDNAEERAKEAPHSFLIPSREARANLQIGDFAKVIFKLGDKGERMWLIVAARNPDGTYEGRLNNDPVDMPVRCDDMFTFGPEHVINIEMADVN